MYVANTLSMNISAHNAVICAPVLPAVFRCDVPGHPHVGQWVKQFGAVVDHALGLQVSARPVFGGFAPRWRVNLHEAETVTVVSDYIR